MSLLKEGYKTGACLLGRKSWRKDWVFLIQTKFTCLGKGYNERFVYFLIARHASINSHHVGSSQLLGQNTWFL
jgi:hypothetical protein